MADDSPFGISHLVQRRDWSNGDGLNWGWHLVGAPGPERTAPCAGLRGHVCWVYRKRIPDQRPREPREARKGFSIISDLNGDFAAVSLS